MMMTAVGIVLYFILSEPITMEERKYWPEWSAVPSFMSVVLLAIQGMKTVLPIENQMKHPEHFLGWFGVNSATIAFTMVVVGLTGFFGYAQYGPDTASVITLNLPTDSQLAEATRLLAALAVMLSLGLTYYVPMEIIWKRVQHKIPSKRVNLFQISFRVILLLLMAGIASGAPEIEPFAGLMGSIGCGTLVVLFPNVYYGRELLPRYKTVEGFPRLVRTTIRSTVATSTVTWLEDES
ncbi:proton-coupled amino acid transporter-like protein pathetic [Uranotaenia lowii]|uniref:proton-coupled amino acid transporter-like protein pathetic n=1 Tax=Uranotaenia lowii TaxID=190385 RepID=UPI002479A263|nr:proton-coupled amino acid transporter-like protein pathetic [Uranotaenia lowii]